MRKNNVTWGIAAIFSIIIWCCLTFDIQAAQLSESTGNEAAGTARNGVLQINLVYIDDKKEEHIISGGSGFLIGDEEGANYVITSNSNVTPSEELRKSVAKAYKVPKDRRGDMTFAVQAVVKRDVVVAAQVVTGSEELDFAILKLAQTIYDRTPLILDTEEERIKETALVYTLGFPEDIQTAQDVSYYTSEDVSVMNGIISKKVMINGALYIQHSASVTVGNAGGPLLNEWGQVIGMNQQIMEDGYFYSVHISEITSVLDALGISYTRYEEEQLPETVDTTSLSMAIENAKTRELTGYTAESIVSYQDAIQQAEALLAREDISEEDVTQGLQLLSNANNVLKVKSNSKIYIIAISIIAVLIAAVIILVVFLLRKGEKKEKPEKPEKSKKTVPVVELPFEPVQKSSETSVLNSAMGFNDGETSVLNEDSMTSPTIAVIRRLRNNETAKIQKTIFYIGKDGLKTDYCIQGNPSISRTHAAIKQVGGEFYLEDLQATNGTYHNDVKLQPSQSVKLTSGDRIRLANEEFVFTI